MGNCQFSIEIKKVYEKLIHLISTISEDNKNLKIINFNNIQISIRDIISYQIGYAKLVIYWYTMGLDNKKFDMPGDGFTKWDYNGLSNHFYKKYHMDSTENQLKLFEKLVNEIIKIVDKENLSKNLEKLGVYDWCTLQSGKRWPLKKWIQINTIAPYKRAYILIKKSFKDS